MDNIGGYANATFGLPCVLVFNRSDSLFVDRFRRFRYACCYYSMLAMALDAMGTFYVVVRRATFRISPYACL